MGGQAGGGSSQATLTDTELPDYIKSIHRSMIVGKDDGAGWGEQNTWNDSGNVSIGGDILVARAANPYAGENAYVPDTPLNDNQDRFDLYAALIDALDQVPDWVTYNNAVLAQSQVESKLDWEDAVDRALAKATNVVLSAAYIDDIVQAHSDSLSADTAIQRARFRAGMADIGAVMSSAFLVGDALILERHTREVSKFRAEFAFQVSRDRTQFVQTAVAQIAAFIATQLSYVNQAVDAIVRLLGLRTSLSQNSVSMLGELNRLKIVAKKEQTDMDLTIDDKEARWDLELWQAMFNGFSSISGSAVTHQRLAHNATGQSALGGALQLGLTAAGTGVGAYFGGAQGAMAGASLGNAAGTAASGMVG